MGYIKGVSKYCDNWRDALDELQVTVEGLKAENSELKARVPKWIPVEERLPSKAGKYLVTVKNGNVYAGTFDVYSERFQCEAVAWMPLPEPYKGGEADD